MKRYRNIIMTVGGILLIAMGMSASNFDGLAIGGCILLGSVLIADAK